MSNALREQPEAPDVRRPKRPAPGPTPAVVTILYVVGTLVLVAVLSTLTTGVTARSVSYTEFKQMVRGGKVEEVVISQDRIRGALKESKEAFTTVRVEDPGLLGELEQRGITVKGELASNWWSSLIGWLLPLALLMLFWTFMLRRATPGQGVMAFGQSRAKIYAEADVKVSFADVAGIDEAVEELREIDVEVKRLMTEAHETALGVLRDHRQALEAVMRRLLDREVVEGAEVRSLVQSAVATGPRAA